MKKEERDTVEKIVNEARALEEKLGRPMLAYEAKPFLQRMERLAAEEEIAQEIKENRKKKKLIECKAGLYNKSTEQESLEPNNIDETLSIIQKAIDAEVTKETPRNAEIYKAYALGETQASIAKRFGISQALVSNLTTVINERVKKRIEAEGGIAT